MTKSNLSYWEYPGFNDQIEPKNQLDLNQGNTPLEKHLFLLPKNYSNISLFLKREDQNPNGSFKDRALAYQISLSVQNHDKFIVLSSSGNAAISCCSYCQKTKIKPIILISPNIPQNKLQQIIKHNPYLIIKSSNARRFAKYIHRKYQLPLLNPSSDNNAALGFETLGWEIYHQLPTCHTIFSYSTSGASIQGIINFYLKNKLRPPKMIAIRLSDKNNKRFYNFPNNKKIIKAIQETNGQLMQISEQLAQTKLAFFHKHHINSSIEGATCLAAIDQYLQLSTTNTPENIVCIISGNEHQTPDPTQDFNIPTIENITQIENIFREKNIQ